MKKLLIVLASVILSANLIAQSPEKISYQAVIRSSTSVLVTNTLVRMRISIIQTSPTGTPVYVETQSPTTNANGLISIEIGTGTTTDNFSAIDWSNGPYFIKTETGPASGTDYTITGTSQILSVPYALHAKTAENYTETDPIFGISVAKAITAVDTSKWNNKLGTEVDGSVTNEIQTISRTGLTVTLSNGGGTFTDSVNVYTAGTGINITNNVISAGPRHYIGELYGGGIVYWVTPDGQHGLIASIADIDGGSGVEWGANTIELAGCDSMTDGAGNTASIVLGLAGLGETNRAAQLCDAYAGGGFTDWYLPSNRELYLLALNDILIDYIFDNDGDANTIGFAQEYRLPTYGRYWSSTEFGDDYAFSYRFGSNEMYTSEKISTYRVRAVRSF